MKKAKIGVIALVTQEYTGSYRAESFFEEACRSMEKENIEVIPSEKVVGNPADALEVCSSLKGRIHGLILIDINWVADSLQYIFTNELSVPVMLWALPFNETYSLACVHHYGTCMKWQGSTYEYVYGTPDNKEVMAKIQSFAKTVSMIVSVKHMRLGLIGPRQTWRVAGPQDMTNEEFEFSKKFGTTILHIEMSELQNTADTIQDEEAKPVLKELLERSGINELSEEASIYMAKIYMAAKRVKEKYKLDAIAAETCPEYSGLMNVQASWLADENVVVDTEGDIGHTMLQYALSVVDEKPAMLGEICSVEDHIVRIYHEGSSAHSLAESKEAVRLQKSGACGCYVGLSMRETEQVTVLSLVGDKGKYKLFHANGKVVKASVQEWESAGTGCLAKVDFGIDGKEAADFLMGQGLDHHYIVKIGDFSKEMAMLSNYLFLEEVNLLK